MAQQNILIIGGHPDDADFNCGGSAIKWRLLGHNVSFLSLTNGNAGHFTGAKEALRERRAQEAKSAAQIFDVVYTIWDIEDGQLQPDLATREKLTCFLREYRPDLIITHRPYDFHPDHRQTSILVQDVAYLVTVPLIYPQVKALEKAPVILYWYDKFMKPIPFMPDVFVDVTDVIDQKARAISQHVSQVYEFTPHMKGMEHGDFSYEEAKLAWVKNNYWCKRCSPDAYRPQLEQCIGDEEASKIQYLEAFERSEFGAQMTTAQFDLLFPFGIRNF